MPVDPAFLQQHYASLSDDALLAIDRADLSDEAQQLYNIELRQRKLIKESPRPSETDAPMNNRGHAGIRTSALIACIAGVLREVISARNSLNQMQTRSNGLSGNSGSSQ